MRSKFLSLVLLVGVMSAATHVSAWNIDIDTRHMEIPKLNLSATATLEKPADELRFTVGVVSVSEHADDSLRQNSTLMQSVVEALQEIGITDEEYETSRFTMQPIYSPTPKNVPADWRPSIVGYEVNNSIIITTGKLDLAGAIIDAANRAGANSVTDINFRLHDPRLYWDEVISAATADAIRDANTIARAAGVNLVRLLNVSLNYTNTNYPRANNLYFAKSAASDILPPIEPGDVTMSATVSIVYEISNK